MNISHILFHEIILTKFQCQIYILFLFIFHGALFGLFFCWYFILISLFKFYYANTTHVLQFASLCYLYLRLNSKPIILSVLRGINYSRYKKESESSKYSIDT